MKGYIIFSRYCVDVVANFHNVLQKKSLSFVTVTQKEFGKLSLQYFFLNELLVSFKSPPVKRHDDSLKEVPLSYIFNICSNALMICF